MHIWIEKCMTSPILSSCSTSMGDLYHLGGRCSADCDLLSVHLHQVLLPKEEEEAAEERRQNQSDRRKWKIHDRPGEWQRPLEFNFSQLSYKQVFIQMV